MNLRPVEPPQHVKDLHGCWGAALLIILADIGMTLAHRWDAQTSILFAAFALILCGVTVRIVWTRRSRP